MRCSDCHFFTNPISGGRDPKNCSELGEEPENKICGSFVPRGSAEHLRRLPEVQLDPDKPVGFSYAKEFHQILGEQLQIERDLYETLDAVQRDFFQNQANAELGDKTGNRTSMERYVEKLGDLRLLHILTGLFECGVYRDVIMAAEIERLFESKPSQETIQGIRAVMRETNADLLRVPNRPSRASVGSSAGGGPREHSQRGAVPAVGPTQRTAKKP